MKKIPIEQIVRRLDIENPWWENSQIPKIYRTFKHRAYLELFYPLVESRKIRRATVLMGPRRVGKTVLLHHTIQQLIDTGVSPKRIAYFSVDHPIYNGLGLESFLDIYSEATGVNYLEDECFIFFDEIQCQKWGQVAL
jgi:predicted AAA+ superfamily ATPase